MADRMAAEILIGGKLSRVRAEALCEAIRDQYVALDWGDGAFEPHTAEDLEWAVNDGSTGGRGDWLRLTNDEVA